MLLHRLLVRQLRVLDVLRANPFLSREQLQMWLGWRERALHVYLTQLCQWNLIRLIHSRHTNIPARAPWVLTLKGLRALANHANLSLFAYLTQNRYSRARLEWLMLRLERVYHIRTFLLRLHRMRRAWSVYTPDVEVEGKSYTEDDPKWHDRKKTKLDPFRAYPTPGRTRVVELSI